MTQPQATPAVHRPPRFLKSSAGASLFGALAAAGPVHAGVDETLRVGLVGCGGRGIGRRRRRPRRRSPSKLVAVGDAFAGPHRRHASITSRRQPKFADRAAVDPDRVFVGFDAYKQLIDSGVDVVLLATPPHFRPQHLAYAVAAGKHCFVEKPVAVDAPGVAGRAWQPCEEAKKKTLSVVSGLCWRYDLGMRESVRQVLEEKAIGDIVAIESQLSNTAACGIAATSRAGAAWSTRCATGCTTPGSRAITSSSRPSTASTRRRGSWATRSRSRRWRLGGRQQRVDRSMATSTTTSPCSTSIPAA